MAQYRLRSSGSGRYIISRKRLGLFWVDYDDPARPTYLIERDMNSLYKKLMKLQDKHNEAKKVLKTTVKDLVETDQFKDTSTSLTWTGGFWPPFKKSIKKPPTDWKSMFPKDELSYDEHLYAGTSDDKFDKQTVFSTTDLGEASDSVVWNREHKGNDQQQQRKKGQQQQKQRGPEYTLDK